MYDKITAGDQAQVEHVALKDHPRSGKIMQKLI